MISIVGKTFNRLTVVKKTSEKKNNSYLWLCECQCGKEAKLSKWHITSGNTKSCGCLKLENVKKMNKAKTTHGMRYTRIYKVWEAMKRRCNSEVCEKYPIYGGRGITYCKEWENFEPFHRWAMENGYEEHLTIDRIDVNGNYEPSNCRWSTWKQQANNKRNTVKN